jgi:hypothetical protein
MNRKNSRKERFLKRLPETTIMIEHVTDKFQDHLSFSFQFFDNSQEAGQDFRDWDHAQLYKLLDKLKEYCKNPLSHWLRMRIGRSNNHVLEIYKNFHHKSDFSHPTHIPCDVEWARFRLEGDMRLIGFLVNKEICERDLIAPNIFYVVFLDENHKFYKMS